MKTIIEWFNIENKEHLQAYHTFLTTGAWPKDFIPKDIEFTDLWQVTLNFKMAQAWCLYNLVWLNK